MTGTIEPRCPYFGKCGGCTSQHIPYELQLENKKKVIARATAMPESEVQVFSGEPYNYRNRMDFIFRPGGLGFRKKGKWYESVGVEQCPISNEKLNQLLLEVNSAFKNIDSFDVKKHTGTFRYAVIRTPRKSSSISFVLNADSLRLKEAIEKIQEYAKISRADNILITRVPHNSDLSIGPDYFVVKGIEMLEEEFLGMSFKFHAQGFFQNNSMMAEQMHNYVNKLLMAYDTKKSHLLDLYGGVGTFGIVNSKLFASTTIVEGVQECIAGADINIADNCSENVRAVLLDDKQLSRLPLKAPLFVITDPPRSGMHPKTIAALNALEPELIIYVSCNPQQLEKDLKHFKGYTIRSAALFDLFPHTPHMEGVVELTKAQLTS